MIDLFEALKSVTALCLNRTLYIKFGFSFHVTAPTQRLRFWVAPRQQSQVVSSPGICMDIIIHNYVHAQYVVYSVHVVGIAYVPCSGPHKRSNIEANTIVIGSKNY